MSPDNLVTEYVRLTARNEWTTLYQKIRSESLKTSGPCTEAQKPHNKILNRYRDVSPFDQSRIVLKRGPTDYINANLIRVERAKRKYILTQGPLSHTVSHFWLMVWEQESRAILMLNKLVEKKQEKCYQYWPSEIGADNILTFDDVNLKVEYLEYCDHSYYLTRLFRLTDLSTQEHRDIVQFHYTTWPDFGVPSSPTAFLDFLKKVRDAAVLEEDVGPAIVHCSAGIGRSGTFCLVDSCLILIEKFGMENVDVKEILYEMRTYRMGLIQTADQLRFSYQAIIEGANLKTETLDNHSVNVDELIEVNSSESDSSDDSLNDDDSEDDEDDDDEPPPLPPPRHDSLAKQQNGTGFIDLERPLPGIPASLSLTDCSFARDTDGDTFDTVPSRPLPNLPQEEEDDESLDDENTTTTVQSESPKSERSENELTHRKQRSERSERTAERKERLTAQVNDIKRKQKANEQWTQLKRSLYKPLFIAGAVAFAGGLAYFFIKN